ncbi:T-complex protein 1 subunit delta [Metschnikowia aff. pulcherrima]|uniref:T-complex protein 1 subunit delta n=2 Tax=Metschnikowia TaxID=27320 RepID=A0A4P6XKR4_9ASCO|nr:T-complex protein 1 subunit delta [Metschnikowia aff. pulcherrima]
MQDLILSHVTHQIQTPVHHTVSGKSYGRLHLGCTNILNTHRMAQKAYTAPLNATFRDKEKPQEVRKANILAARAVSDAIRTSLGPKGMDKMIRTKKGEIIISNDGATILKHMAILHPAARMLVDVSAAQDVEAGDGTTSVAILTGSLLGAAEKLLNKGIHPTLIGELFQRAAARVCEVFLEMSHKISLNDREVLIKAALTSLSSKIVSQYSLLLSPLAVDSVLKVMNSAQTNVDLNDIRLIKKVGGTIDDTALVDGVVLTQTVLKNAGGPTRMEKARIGFVQFQLSPPKPDMENNVVVSDYRQMDKILKEERAYLLNICKKIKKARCNVLLIQKSILRDAVNDLALHFLAKLNILVIKDIERDEVEFLTKATGCKPIADIDNFTEDRLGSADLVEEIESSGSKIVQITGVSAKNTKPTVSVVVRGANQLVLDETERSIHDALCVIRCLVKEKALIAGGGAPEIEASRVLIKEATRLSGVEHFVYQEFAQALEVIPTTLAENAGMNPINVVTDLRNKHEMGEKNAGISVRRSGTSNTFTENVLQPTLVNTSAVTLAAETVKSILRIDDITFSR